MKKTEKEVNLYVEVIPYLVVFVTVLTAIAVS